MAARNRTTSTDELILGLANRLYGGELLKDRQRVINYREKSPASRSKLAMEIMTELKAHEEEHREFLDMLNAVFRGWNVQLSVLRSALDIVADRLKKEESLKDSALSA